MKKVKKQLPSITNAPAVHWLAFLYLLAEFFPGLETVDNMGSQWLFLAILNLFSGFFLVKYRARLPRLPVLQLPLISLLLFTVVSAVSFFSAFNVVESIVTFSRLLITVNAVIYLLIMMHLRPALLKELLTIAGVIACIQSVRAFGEFAANYKSFRYVYEIIFNIRASNGNKNILAASIVVKLPALLYLFNQFRGSKRMAAGMGLLITISAIILLNARAAYISLFLVIIGYCIGLVLISRKQDKNNEARQTIIWMAGISIAAVILMQWMMTTVEHTKKAGTYGSLTERVGSIDVSNEGSSGRLVLWRSALDFISKHPITGGGFGNWKIHTIPYERYIRSGFGSSKHAHCDFLEVTAETGIPGGLIYLSIFILLASLSISALLRRTLTNEQRMIWMTLLFMLVAYAIDSLFNFPLERPSMQIAFTLVMAGTCVLLYPKISDQQPKNSKMVTTTVVIFSLIGIGTTYVSKQVFTSLRTQNMIANDWLGNPKPTNKVIPSETIIAGLPWIPNLNQLCMPIACVKAKYLCEEKKYAEAFRVLNEDNSNPHLYYAEMVRSKSFDDMGRKDSAIYYARIAFNNRPCNLQLFTLLSGFQAQQKDSAALHQSYLEIKKWNKSPKVCSVYCQNMLFCTNNPASFISELEIAVREHPDDKGLLFDKYFYTGGILQNKSENVSAVANYRKALEIKPTDFYVLKNMAGCLVDMQQYAEAVTLYTSLINSQQVDNGRCFFNRGYCFWNLGRQAEACPDFNMAMKYGYTIDPPILRFCSGQKIN